MKIHENSGKVAAFLGKVIVDPNKGVIEQHVVVHDEADQPFYNITNRNGKYGQAYLQEVELEDGVYFTVKFAIDAQNNLLHGDELGQFLKSIDTSEFVVLADDAAQQLIRGMVQADEDNTQISYLDKKNAAIAHLEQEKDEQIAYLEQLNEYLEGVNEDLLDKIENIEQVGNYMEPIDNNEEIALALQLEEYGVDSPLYVEYTLIFS